MEAEQVLDEMQGVFNRFVEKYSPVAVFDVPLETMPDIWNEEKVWTVLEEEPDEFTLTPGFVADGGNSFVFAYFFTMQPVDPNDDWAQLIDLSKVLPCVTCEDGVAEEDDWDPEECPSCGGVAKVIEVSYPDMLRVIDPETLEFAG